MARKKIIAGNWKMNKTPSEALELTALLADCADEVDVDVVFCVPAIDIMPVGAMIADTPVKLGAQNMYFENEGAFTGEISPKMLADAGVEYVIIGHSERRGYFGETDESVNKKIKKALECGLNPIVCVGESLLEREQGISLERVRIQVRLAFLDVPAEEAVDVTVAYEPIWAIGTGLNATNEQAEEVCAEIRKVLSEIYNASVAEAIRIQYGGSMNGKNAEGLLSMPNIDGGLIGGASLKEEFKDIIKAAAK
ncbi:MAG: triose-phosphate isomerase [Firmicutes bacterium]|nr:triose-phosphate isomerase [Bacillota bacterium]